MHLPSRPADWWLLCRHRRVSFLFSGGVRRAERRRHTPWSKSVGGSATPMLYVVCELPVRRRCPAALRSVRGRTALPPRHQCSAAAATAAAATRSSPSVLSAVKQFVRSSIHQRAWISTQLQSILQRHASSMRHSMVYAGHSASSSSSSPFLASSFCSIQANSMYDGHGLMQLPAIIITWPTIDTNSSRDTEAILYCSAMHAGLSPPLLSLSLSLPPSD